MAEQAPAALALAIELDGQRTGEELNSAMVTVSERAVCRSEGVVAGYVARAAILLVLGLVSAVAAGQEAQPSFEGTVVRVIDGDTVDVRIGARVERVRLIGVDTPETVHPEIGAEPWGPEASEFTKRHLPPGTVVRLELDVQERDRYGRLLAYLYLPDGRMLNALLLEAGLAQLLTVPPNVRYADVFVRLQREAREAGRGMWSEQPVAQVGGAGVRIERVDLRGEEMVLVNEGPETVDLSGWTLVSVVGNQQFRFPPGTTLGPGQRLTVRSGAGAIPGPGALVWTRAYVWNDGGDPAELRDSEGRLVSRYPE